MQNEIISVVSLLTQEGTITKEGWARSPFWKYDRTEIHANALRIKEWDYFSVISHTGKFAISFTASDLGFAGLFAICFLDLEKKQFYQVDSLKLFTLGKTGFPASPESGSVKFSDSKLSIEIIHTPEKKVIHFKSPSLKDFNGGEGLEGSIEFQVPANLETMNIATSWKENRKAFYYNHKANCLPVKGSFAIGKNRYELFPEKDFGGLDWGRGYWTYKNRWYWSSLSTLLEGKPFGLNLGYGFSDRSPASENVVIYDNKIHKLEEVEFLFDSKDYMRPWTFVSSDKKLDLHFTPVVDRNSAINLLLIASIQHQVFGLFSGEVILDSGKKLTLKNIPGFAEDVFNKW